MQWFNARNAKLTSSSKTELGRRNSAISASHAAAILLSATLASQPCNRVEAPDWCFILLSGQGQLPISSQTVGYFSGNDFSMGRQDRRKTQRSCCFSRSQGNRNRPDVVFPAFKKIVTYEELWPGLSAVVIRQRSEGYIANWNTWTIVFSIQTIGMLSPKSCRQRDTS